MGVDDLQDVQRARDDDTQVAVAPVVVPQVADERRRIAAVELVRRAVGVFVRIVFVVAQQVVGLLEALVTAVVPVDTIDHRGESAHDERHFPVALIVYLSRTGEDAGQRGGFLDVRHVVGLVAHGRVADEIDVRGDRDPEVGLPPGVAADHPRLQGVEFRGARSAHVGIGLVLPFEWFVGLVLVDVKPQSGSHQSVEDRQFPVLLVVDLSVAGQHGREPAHLRERHRVAHQPSLFEYAGFGRGVDAQPGDVEMGQCHRIEVMAVVGAQGRNGRGVGEVTRRGDRVELLDDSGQFQRVALGAERIRFFEHAAPDDRARSAVELGTGGQPQHEGCGEQQQAGPDACHIESQERLANRSMKRSMSLSSSKPMTILPPPLLVRLIEISCEKNFSNCSTSRR